jgi:DNA-binding PadR family transcriptional regulator
MLLALIERQPLHGYELRRQYDQILGQRKPLRSGQIYSTLTRLERDDLIQVAAVSRGSGPEKTNFHITEHGGQVLERWFELPESPQPYLQPDLYAKILLAITTRRDVLGILGRQRAAHQEVIGRFSALQSSASVVDVVTADLLLLHLDADLRWMDQTQSRLAELVDELLP